MNKSIHTYPHTASSLQRACGLIIHPAIAAVLLALPNVSVAAAPASPPPRERLSLNTGWRFTKDDPADAAGKLAYTNISDWVIPTGAALVKNERLAAKKRPEGNLGSDVAYTQPDFDDRQWRLLNLPHDWGVEGPFQQQYDGATGRLPYWGVAWYRKHLDIPASDQGKQVYLDVDGAMSYAAIWLNGQFVGGWPFGYASWRVDLTPYVKPGADNVLAIRLDNPALSSRWYPGGGIYRNVWLVKTSPVHVAQWGTYVTTPKVSKTAATVRIKVNVQNDSVADAITSVKTAIHELDQRENRGKAIAEIATDGIRVPSRNQQETEVSISFKNPKLWSTTSPNRYTAVTTIEHNGKIVDQVETPFGIRSLKFDPQNGFFLNGEPLKFNGVCNHHDLGALGSAINTRALQRQLEILRDMGCNAIRTSHNPPAPELLDLCDQMGFVVMDETFDTWQRPKRPNDYARLFTDWHEQDTRMLVRRDRNHPSVIMWSIGNEIAEQGMGTNGAAVAAELTRIVQEEDPTRPTTAACNSARPNSPFPAAIDAVGLNYQGSRPPNPQYPAFHESFPNQFLFGSETASTISSRGEYTFPVAAQPGAISSAFGGGRGRGGGDNTNAPPVTPPPAPPGQDVTNHQMSSYDLYYPNWATSPDTEFAAQDRYPFVGGEFVWTGFDYLGEPTPWGRGNDPSRSSYFGIIDLAGFKKDRFFIYQAKWRPDFPMAHILPHWNWPDRVGQVTPVHVYTSGDEAELFLNGKSLGRKKKAQHEYRLRWDDVKYAPGELKVVAYKKGRRWATDVMKTAGPAAKLAMQADRNKIRADGEDLSFVTVTVADKNGLLVPRSKNRVRFEIEGPGEIVATDNGDATSFELFQSKKRAAYNGLALVIIRAKSGQPGTIVLKAQSDGLKDATSHIRSQKTN